MPPQLSDLSIVYSNNGRRCELEIFSVLFCGGEFSERCIFSVERSVDSKPFSARSKGETTRQELDILRIGSAKRQNLETAANATEDRLTDGRSNGWMVRRSLSMAEKNSSISRIWTGENRSRASGLPAETLRSY